MADNNLSSAQALLNEFVRPLQTIYPQDHVLLAQWNGSRKNADSLIPISDRVNAVDNPEAFGDREVFGGKYAKVPVDVAQLQGGGWIAEGGTINQPIQAQFTEAHINLATFVQPFSITLEVEEDSMTYSSAQMLERLTDKARQALAENVNDAMNTDAAQLAVADTSQATAAGLTLTVKAGTDMDKLYVGKVVDVLTASNGADPGQGLRRKIASFAETASPPTITFSTTQQASDGGSGNISLSNAVAVYTAGSYGNAMQGIETGINVGTGTWQNINLSTYPQFKPIDGRNGVATTAPLSDAMLDAGVQLGQRGGSSGNYDWGIGDPSAINVYKNGKQSQVHYVPTMQILPSGFAGIEYSGTGKPIPLVGERKHGSGKLKLVRQDMATTYGRRGGPDFDRRSGSQLKTLDRTLRVEAWLVDRLQWGFHDGSKLLHFDNLSTS